MAFEYINAKKTKYFLHARVVELRGGKRMQTIYFFGKKLQRGGMTEVPHGFEVVENKRTGLPVLRRVK